MATHLTREQLVAFLREMLLIRGGPLLVQTRDDPDQPRTKEQP
jgi:hypothetical protein